MLQANAQKKALDQRAARNRANAVEAAAGRYADALMEIEAMAPTCSDEAEAMTLHQWRKLCRDMQSVARLARKGVDRKGRQV